EHSWGVIFHFISPLPANRSNAPGDGFMTGEKIVLHVEDNPDNRLLVRRLLQAYGYAVVEAENAAMARKQLTAHQPHLILMDINMPDMDGYTLTNEFKAMPHLKDVPIVAITANVMKGDR